MVSKGKSLELLMKQIEELCIPSGFCISANEKAFDDSGNQVAEFDITISGKVGTTFFKWLIECRDRPSDGPAPNSWIEQLAARQERFTFNKVIAVSTTGFAKGIKKYAKARGIELRSVKKISADGIAEWLKMSELNFNLCWGVINHITFVAKSKPMTEAIQSIMSLVAEKDVYNKQIFINSTGVKMSMRNVWVSVLNANPQLFDGLSSDTEPKRRTVLQIPFEPPTDQYYVLTDIGPIEIVRLIVDAELSVTNKKVPLKEVTQYTNLSDQKVIAQSAHFETVCYDQTIDVTFHKVVDKQQTYITAVWKPEK